MPTLGDTDGSQPAPLASPAFPEEGMSIALSGMLMVNGLVFWAQSPRLEAG